MPVINSKPPWLKVRLPSGDSAREVADLLRRRQLNTVCQSARCPNLGECWSARTATFLILGDACTRNCTFCAVTGGIPLPPDPDEPLRVAQSVKDLGLAYAVITSVTRDDLPDGGAGQFAEAILEIRAISPDCRIEVLIPDFGGDEEAQRWVCNARPDVLNHNLETVPSLYPSVRPEADYQRSLELLARHLTDQDLDQPSFRGHFRGDLRGPHLRAPRTKRARSRRSISNGVMHLTPSAMHGSGILIFFVEVDAFSCVTTVCPWASAWATR